MIRSILGGDEEAFWKAEAGERKASGVPPYGRMAGIILSSTDVAEVFDFGSLLAQRSEPLRRIGAEVWGPAPAPMSKIKDEYRVQFFLKGHQRRSMREALLRALDLRPELKRRTTIDVDPNSVL